MMHVVISCENTNSSFAFRGSCFPTIEDKQEGKPIFLALGSREMVFQEIAKYMRYACPHGTPIYWNFVEGVLEMQQIFKEAPEQPR